MKLTLLSGGTGTPKLLDGLLRLPEPPEITVVVNTGDDVEISGNLVCPDLDTVLYTAGGIIDRDTWFGIENDSFHTHQRIQALSRQNPRGPYLPSTNQKQGHPLSHNRRFSGFHEFMRIGDRDRATHITRSALLEEGADLTRATELMVEEDDLPVSVLPMSNDPVSTFIHTPEGPMHFQEFWIGRGGEPEVESIEFRGAGEARAPGSVFNALQHPVLIGPSNPVSSIGPILSLPGIRKALGSTDVTMISPFVNDRVFSGPAGTFLEAMEYDPSTAGVIDFYRPFLDRVILDEADHTETQLPVFQTNSRMDSEQQRLEFAREVCGWMAE